MCQGEAALTSRSSILMSNEKNEGYKTTRKEHFFFALLPKVVIYFPGVEELYIVKLWDAQGYRGRHARVRIHTRSEHCEELLYVASVGQ